MKQDIFITLTEMIGAAVAGGWVTHILSIRSKVRQEKANAAKAETEVESDKIANLRKVIDDAYRPIIEDLRNQVEGFKSEVRELSGKVDRLEAENDTLREENRALRDAVRSINPDLVPSFLSIKAKNQPRGKSGQFVKKTGDEADR
jgi:predicted RNase H-like nuclease (RuvC/YqgF family)